MAMRNSTWINWKVSQFKERNIRCANCSKPFMVWRRQDISGMGTYSAASQILDTESLSLVTLLSFSSIMTGRDQITIILVYVNDIAIFDSLMDIKDVKEFIGSWYRYTDLGEIKHFLSLHIIRDHSKKTLSVDQSHYVQHIINQFDMTMCHLTYTPLNCNTKLVANCKKNLWLIPHNPISTTC